MTGSQREQVEVQRPWTAPFLPGKLFLAFAVAVLAITSIAVLTFRARVTQIGSAEQLLSTMRRIEATEALLSALKDAETGQRGYLLTGQENYLDPYRVARTSLPTALENLRTLLGYSQDQRARQDSLQKLVITRLKIMEETIELQRGGDHGAAVDMVRSNRGKEVMDQLRAVVKEIGDTERAKLDVDTRDRQEAVASGAFVTFGGLAVLLALVLLSAYMTSRDYHRNLAESWVRSGQTALTLNLQGEQRLEKLGEGVLTFLARYLDAKVGAAFIREGEAHFKRVATYALAQSDGHTEAEMGEGILGQAAKERRALHVENLPKGYLPIASTVGRADSQSVLVSPAVADGHVHGVLELGFLRKLGPAEVEMVSRASEVIAVAIRSSRDRTRLEELLEETQRQSEELQSQQEELRVSNEELQEQGRALRESQARLETQHEELEETNSQLEEQMQLLEQQKDDLSRAQQALSHKASELALANQYKNDFLANMSHELRTPLNSSLILAKLLADNPQGNLTDEQVKFAQTISAAGKDLLALINDILDLAKIESGKVDVNVETVPVASILEGMERTFGPVARDKGLSLRMRIHEGVPATLDTDAQRLAQVLKNLIANAIKFTERGEVSLDVHPTPVGTVAFEVKDTGIGIPANQQELIFEAFRQADSGVHRKFGGTGLGLSISRELARLLQGDIRVYSAPGEGSTFTVTVPRKMVSSPVPERTPKQEARPRAPEPLSLRPLVSTPRPATATAPESAGEREKPALAQGGERVILIVEDDVRFAEILQRTAKERGFTTAVANTADDGIALARRLIPSAILLDMNLPDHSGLSVLDQLKRRAATRHIPVHVLSVADYSLEALQMGAVGYALKPVEQEQLREAFQKLEAKLTQTMRRVLVVEDNEVQRDSVRRLLQSEEVEVVGVGTASLALEKLGQERFDCVVMDLGLQDASGFELLETMAGQEAYAFPPVIVYTGRSLSPDEETRLRKFSKSIIIKGAHSPERLLDEVTLFLHQVESKLPADRQRMLAQARHREAVFEGRRILVVEDDVRNIFALSSILEPKGAKVEVARNGREALDRLAQNVQNAAGMIDLVLMDIMMPEMDGLTAMKEIRKRPEWEKLPIIALTAKAMRDDQDTCLAAGANDYIAKPLDVEKLLSLVRVWMPK